MTTILLLGQRQVIKRSAHTARKKLARCFKLVQRRCRRSELCCAQSKCVQQGGAGLAQVKLFLFARTPLHNTHLKSFEIASAAHL
jgi:hypothetical protein